MKPQVQTVRAIRGSQICILCSAPKCISLPQSSPAAPQLAGSFRLRRNRATLVLRALGAGAARMLSPHQFVYFAPPQLRFVPQSCLVSSQLVWPFRLRRNRATLALRALGAGTARMLSPHQFVYFAPPQMHFALQSCPVAPQLVGSFRLPRNRATLALRALGAGTARMISLHQFVYFAPPQMRFALQSSPGAPQLGNFALRTGIPTFSPILHTELKTHALHSSTAPSLPPACAPSKAVLLVRNLKSPNPQ